MTYRCLTCTHSLLKAHGEKKEEARTKVRALYLKFSLLFD